MSVEVSMAAGRAGADGIDPGNVGCALIIAL